MAATYPASAKSFTPINDGDAVADEMWEEAYDEITALEQALLTGGLAHNLTPDASANARTLGSSSKFWGIAYLKALTLADATELTIASGAVTVTQGYHKIDTEADAAADDLDTLTATGLSAGFITTFRAENVARVVTFKDGTGNLLLNGDFALNATDRTITLLFDGTNWRELARSISISEDVLVPAGGGTERLKVAGLIDTDDTQVATSGSSETALRTFTVPSNTLNANGRTVRATFIGTLAADTDNKQLRVRLGGISGTVVASISQNSATFTRFRVTVTITRIGSNSQRVVGEAFYHLPAGTSNTPHATMEVTTDTQTDSSNFDLVLTGTGVNANDIVYEASWVEMLN